MHVHGPVQPNGHGQLGAGLFPLSCLDVQRTEAEVAVRLERTHAQLLGQGEGLALVGFGRRGIGRVGMGMDGAKLVQRKRLKPALLLVLSTC
jgi:hypothetical protein